ncbi:hypothetical protein [Pseudomonas sp.]|uniref:hypothetical protein n=1 Tax=Pseudomonas sp. TaxID=306 RepID=UPI002FC788DC
MTASDALKKMECEYIIPKWSKDDAIAIVESLGGDIGVIEKADLISRHGRDASVGAIEISTMYILTLVAAKLEQEQQQ